MKIKEKTENEIKIVTCITKNNKIELIFIFILYFHSIFQQNNCIYNYTTFIFLIPLHYLHFLTMNIKVFFIWNNKLEKEKKMHYNCCSKKNERKSNKKLLQHSFPLISFETKSIVSPYLLLILMQFVKTRFKTSSMILGTKTESLLPIPNKS